MKINATMLTTVTITPEEQDRIVRERLAQLLGLSASELGDLSLKDGKLLMEDWHYHSSTTRVLRDATPLDQSVITVLSAMAKGYSGTMS
ncbi:hypothetical protein [Shewanella algae]|uniref:hypothetical protein n=1 Tax=Shewanella algae TaxID=38313 RepID=UPI0031F57C9E